MNEVKTINQLIGSSDGMLWLAIWGWIIIFQLALHLLTAWGLWKINKKLWEPHAWLSWIPLIQVYSFVRASWYPNIWILWLALGSIAIMIPIVWIIIFLILLIKVLHWISLRTWNWKWMTAWFLFLGFIFFPLVGHKFNPENIKKIEDEKETVEL
jgi:hypothetical protein